MPQQFPELAFVAIDARPHRPDGRERIGAATGPGWFESSWDLCHGSKCARAGRTTSACTAGSRTS